MRWTEARCLVCQSIRALCYPHWVRAGRPSKAPDRVGR